MLVARDVRRHADKFRLEYDASLMGHSDPSVSRSLKENTLESEFVLQGATFPNTLYYTSIQIGTPRQEFNVDVDTGSSLLWVNCLPCNPCTSSQYLQFNAPFDTSKSSSAASVFCANATCRSPDQSVRTSACISQDPKAACSYAVVYGDGSTSLGTLLWDVVHLPAGKRKGIQLPALIGCGNSQSGLFLNGVGWTYYQPIDGLFGLGRGNFSLMSWLANNQGRKNSVRPILSHCLGGEAGGGAMSIGLTGELPLRMAFTPLVPHPIYYVASLVEVFVGGQRLSVNPRLYGSGKPGVGNAIFDSATTFSILPPKLITAIQNKLLSAVGLPAYTFSLTNNGTLCFAPTAEVPLSSVMSRLPTINVQFQGQGVFMNVAPRNYMFNANDGATPLLCTQLIGLTGFNVTSDIRFVIGEVWMRNFFVLYDLENGRMGWTSAKC